MDRRGFLRAAAAAPLLVAAVPAGTGGTGPGPFGALRGPDGNGLMLPEGFRARVLARAGEPVAGTAHRWHAFPDGGATFATEDGGWIYVSNSEVDGGGGGVGAIRFSAAGEVVSAYPVLTGTSRNCAGGVTPWNTWCSCEEIPLGRVWECDPWGGREAVVRPAMGTFWHEAVAVDPEGRAVYQTADSADGRLYRFTPARWGDLGEGVLEAARTADDGTVTWVAADDPDATTYAGGEGISYHDGVVVFTTKSDQRIRAYDTRALRMRVLYEPGMPGAPEIDGPDNTVFTLTGDLYVCEDTDESQELVLLGADGTKAVVLRCSDAHAGSELAGAAFDPSGTRLYVSSQRMGGGGVTYEVTGPFGAAGTTSTTGPSRPATTGRAAGRPDDTGGATGGGDFPFALVGGTAGGLAALAAAGGLAWLHRRRRGAGA